VFVGGFIGTVARAELAEVLPTSPGQWPWATEFRAAVGRLGRNATVPLMVIAVGDSGRIAEVLPDLGDMLVTVERVRICKRDGHALAAPEQVDPGRAVWQKLMVYTSEQTLIDGQPLHQRLIRELRAAGAAGATSLRGIWGYHGDHRPHGDSFWQLRRRVPVVTVIVDTPERIRR
jgi:PII-like signaling protein